MIVKRLLFAFMLTLVVCQASASLAESLAGFKLHNISSEPDGSYRVSGADPYFVFSPIHQDKKANYLILTLNLPTEHQPASHDGSPIEIPMELFFKPHKDDEQQFDPLFKLKFRLDGQALTDPQHSIALALPDTYEFEAHHSMRLDIDSCKQCRITIPAHPYLVSLPQQNSSVIQPYRIINGKKAIPQTGREIMLSDWQLRDLEHSQGLYVAVGQDPFMISPTLDSSTENLGGVYFELSVTDQTEKNQDFQLFYATEQHGFVRQATTLIRVKADDSGTIKFVVPLGFLNTSHPRSTFLKRLRLDYPPNQATTKWQLKRVALLHQDKMAEQQSLIPRRIIENRWQSPGLIGLSQEVIKKVTADLGFTLSYLLLLFVTALGFWRSLRK